MVTRHKNFQMMRGDTYIFSVKFNGFNADRNVESMYFTCSSNLISESLEFWLSFENGITRSADKDEYVYFIKIDPDSTRNMLPGVYFYDLQVTIDGDVFTILEGDLTIKADVTPNDADAFYRVSASEGVDPNEYFQALDVTDTQSFFTITDSDYLALAKALSNNYKAKTRYVKGEFVKYSGYLYFAKNLITSSPASFNSSQWESMGVIPNA